MYESYLWFSEGGSVDEEWYKEGENSIEAVRPCRKFWTILKTKGS